MGQGHGFGAHQWLLQLFEVNQRCVGLAHLAIGAPSLMAVAEVTGLQSGAQGIYPQPSQTKEKLTEQLGSQQRIDRDRARSQLRSRLRDSSIRRQLLQRQITRQTLMIPVAAGTTSVTLTALKELLSKDACAASWHERLAWLTAAEVGCTFPPL